MKTEKNKISAFELFNHLKNEGFSLSPDDYGLLLNAVYEDTLNIVYPKDPYNTAIIKLCKSLWVKSNDDEKKFNEIVQSELSSYEESVDTHHKEKKLRKIVPQKKQASIQIPSTKYNYINTNGKEEEFEERVFEIKDDLYEKKPEDLGNLYFPATRKEIQKCFDKVEHTKKCVSKKMLNMNATIQKLIQNGGKLVEYVYSQQSKFKMNNYYLLIDQSKSMRPFKFYINRLINIAKKTQLITENNVLYFENIPEKWLYADPSFMHYHATGKILQNCSCAIIISDAGYARGRLNEYRIELTKNFNSKLKLNNTNAIWLNPLPKIHWFSIGFSQVHEYVRMFDMSEYDLNQAVTFLNNL